MGGTGDMRAMRRGARRPAQISEKREVGFCRTVGVRQTAVVDRELVSVGDSIQETR